METGLMVSATPRPFVEGFLVAVFLAAGFLAFMVRVATG